MRSKVRYLISGAGVSITGSSFACDDTDNFSVALYGAAATVGSNPASGTINIDATVEDSASWVTIFSNTFAGNSGVITQFNGPFSKIRAASSSLSTGVFTVACRYSYTKD